MNITNRNIAIGLSLSLILPLLISLWFIPEMKLTFENRATFLGLLAMWVLALLLVCHIFFIERDNLSSIGWKQINLKQISIAVFLGILLSLLIPLVYYAASYLVGDMNTSLNELNSLSKFTIFTGIITAAITEELLRAYPIERLKSLTGKHYMGVLLSLIVFCVIHTNSWNVFHILTVVLPLGLVLTIIYIRTRNLIFTMIVHFMIDFPLLFI